MHRANIVHRDIKPENFFVDDAGHLVLGDFGLAFWSKRPINSFARANIRGYVGTPGYMAPEQARHESYDYKVDIFALGCTFVDLFGNLSKPWLYQLPGVFALTNDELETALHNSVRMLVTPRFAPIELLMEVSKICASLVGTASPLTGRRR